MQEQVLCQEGETDMVSADTKAVIARARRIYAEQLQAVLEPEHRNQFVAIEPEFSQHFLANPFDEAVRAARANDPTRLSHIIRIEHRATFHLGACGEGERCAV
jgi:hypothetical protein